MRPQTHCSLLVLAVASAFLISLAAVCPAQETRPDPLQMRLGLELGRAGDHEAAFAVFSALLRRHPGNVDVNYRYSEAAMATGRYAHAVMALERVLLLRPEADRARLDMALAYLRLGQEAKAEALFREVLARRPPPAVRANVERLLEQIAAKDRRALFSGYLSAGLFYDDNVNVGPADRELETLIGVMRLTDSGMPKKDFGAAGFARLNMLYRLDQDNRLFLNMGGDAYAKRHFKESDQDFDFFTPRAGLRYLGTRWLAQAMLKYEYLRQDDTDLLYAWGVEPTFIYMLSPQAHLQLVGRFEKHDHRQNNARDSGYMDLETSLRLFFGMRDHEFRVGVRGFSDDANSDRFTNTGYELSLGTVIKLPWQTNLSVFWDWRDSRYKDKPSSLAFDKRRDERWRVSVSLTKHLDEILKGLGTTISYQHTNNNSNFGVNSYRRDVATWNMFYSF